VAVPADQLNLGLLLFIPYRSLEDRVFAALAAAGFDDITSAQARVFQRIGPRGSRLTELAQAAQMTKQAAGFLVGQLERAGYVERVADPSDGRARLIRITPRGTQTIQISAAVIADIEAEWTDHVGRENIDQLRQTLSALRQITDPYQ
jgi:DNA-binding MarR family transcriptional regulator